MRRFDGLTLSCCALALASACSGDGSSEVVYDAAPPGPPVFEGVGAAEIESGTSARLRWDSALDDATPRGRIVYRVYRGVGDGPVDTSTPVAASIPGDTNVLVQGLDSDESYRFIVRAVDEDGNEDTNIRAVTITTGDDDAPLFEGVTGASIVTSGSLLVQWKPATDEVSFSHKLTYRVFVSTDADTLFDEPVATSTPGATSIVIDGQPAETELFVAVRAVDEAGNEDTNTRVVSTVTPEGNAPTFGGVRRATPGTTSVELRWSPAADDTTASSAIVYAVYLSTTPAGENLLEPYVVSGPGVTRITVEGLEPETTYYFIVRARDLVGNEDDNTVELSAKTAPPDETAPTFDGVTTLVSTTPTSLHVEWIAASDDVTPADDLVYDIYLATTAGGENFATPTHTTLPGRTSADLLGLTPQTGYSVVVRARDAAGNRDANENEKSATTQKATSDVMPPVLSGNVTVQRTSAKPGFLLVSYPLATDDTESSSGIRYHVCVAEVGATSTCSGASFIENVNATSDFGSGSVFVTGLLPRTAYSVTVRAEDASGNVATSGISGEGTTATSYVSNVEPILESRCNQCHSYSYGALVQVPVTYVDPKVGSLYLVSSGDPAKSYLFRKIRPLADESDPFSVAAPNGYEGERMPSDKTDALTSDTEAVLYDWIKQGAFDN